MIYNTTITEKFTYTEPYSFSSLFNLPYSKDIHCIMSACANKAESDIECNLHVPVHRIYLSVHRI